MCVRADLLRSGSKCKTDAQCQSGVCKEYCCNAEGKGADCVTCQVRWTQNTGGKCQRCAANFYRTSDRECVACPKGYVSSQGSEKSGDCRLDAQSSKSTTFAATTRRTTSAALTTISSSSQITDPSPVDVSQKEAATDVAHQDFVCLYHMVILFCLLLV